MFGNFVCFSVYSVLFLLRIFSHYSNDNLKFQSKTEAEKEVIETLQKALQYCDLDENNPKYPLYQYRAAIIHYRIGTLYHSHIWSTPNDSSNRKNIIQLAKINYEKAAKLYFQSSDPVNYLTAQMQRFALSEYLTESKLYYVKSHFS